MDGIFLKYKRTWVWILLQLALLLLGLVCLDLCLGR